MSEEHKITIVELTVAGRLAEILRTGKYSDVAFILKNGETVKGHKLIFTMSSPVFENMLYGDQTEIKEVKIEDMEPEVFKILVEFLYTDELKIQSVSNALFLLEIVNKYKISHLERKVEDYLMSNIHANDALEFYEFAIAHNISSLKNFCLQLLLDETEKALNSEKFYNCGFDILELVVNQDRLNISELELFNHVEKWAYNKSEKDGLSVDSVLPSLRSILGKIRFLSMSPSEFIASPYRSELLTAEEKHTILLNLSDPGCAPLPLGFSDSSMSRSPVCCHYHNVKIDPLASSLWAHTRLGDGYSSRNILQVNQMNSEEKASNETLVPVSRSLIFESLLVDGFKASSRIIFTGVVLNTPRLKWFRIDFLCKNKHFDNRVSGLQRRRSSVHEDDVDVAFCFNGKFDLGTVVCNTPVKGSWREEWEEKGPILGFTRGSSFVLDIHCRKDSFQVFVNSSPYCQYSHHVDPGLITHVAAGGCIDLHSIIYYPSEEYHVPFADSDLLHNLQPAVARLGIQPIDVNYVDEVDAIDEDLEEEEDIEPGSDYENNVVEEWPTDDDSDSDGSEEIQRNEREVNNPSLTEASKAIILENLLSDGFRPTSRVTITGVVLNAPDRFRVDFLCKSDPSDIRGRRGPFRRASLHDDDNVNIAFHFNVRFDDQNIVRNTKTRSAWSDDVENDGPLVFSRGSTFVLDIYCGADAFQVSVNGSQCCEYRHRIQPNLITHLAVGGCVVIHSVVYRSHKGVWQQFVKVVPVEPCSSTSGQA